MLGRRASHRKAIFAAIVLGVLASPAAAQGAIRYVTVGGMPANDCSAPDAAHGCDLATAIHGTGGNVPNSNDEVVIEPGSYSLSTDITEGAPNLNIHGVLDQPRPVINQSGIGGIHIGTGGSPTISYLDFESTATNNSLNLFGGLAERLVLRGNWGGGPVCQCFGGILRDSVVVNTGGGMALGVVSNGGSGNGQYRNVTAYSTQSGGPAIEVLRTGAIATLTIDAYNTVARNVAGGTDVVADGQGTSITFHHSNYGTSAQNNMGVVQDAPGDPHQTATPQFTNAAAGDFSELAGSPTIDAGLDDPLNGPLDFAGNPRMLGPATDIGAFEFVPPSPPANMPAAMTPPTITPPVPHRCKKKKGKKSASAAKKKGCRKKRK